MRCKFKITKIGLLIRIPTYICLLNILFSFEIVFADQFQYQYRSARYLGRGDAGIASAVGADAMFYNPAGIAQGSKQFKELLIVSPQVEGSENLQTAYDKRNEGDKQALEYILQNKNKPFYASAQNLSAVVFKKLGIGAMQRGVIDAEVKEDFTTGMPSVNVNGYIWNGGYVTIAQDVFNGHLLLGITTKYVQKRQFNLNLTALQIDSELQNTNFTELFKDSERKGDSFGADFGSMIIFHKETETQLGVVVRNVGMEYKWVIPPTGKGPDYDPAELNIGGTTSFGTKRGRVKLFADYRDVMNVQESHYSKHTHLGLEYNLENIFYVMAGLNQGYLTYGLGLSVKVVRVELGSYTEEMGGRPGQTPNTRYFARLSLGWLL